MNLSKHSVLDKRFYTFFKQKQVKNFKVIKLYMIL